MKTTYRDVKIMSVTPPIKNSRGMTVEFYTEDATCFGGKEDYEEYAFNINPFDFIDSFDKEMMTMIKDYLHKQIDN